MTAPSTPAAAPFANAPFGRALCAMITPFTAAGALDLDGAQVLAERLVADGCEGLVLSGTTGESPTTSDAEKNALVRAVREAIGDRATLVAGVGSNDTAHTGELALEAEKAGADGLLVVTPYYSKPPQEAIEAHFRAVADVSGLPVVLYDIPGRTGARIEPDTMLRLAEHPRIVAVKDCAYDLLGSAKVMAGSDLAYYTGCDEFVLPLYALGGAGFISTVANVAPRSLRAIVDAFDAGDTARATRGQLRLTELIELMMASGLPGAVTAKALLNALGLPAGPVRAPLLPADRGWGLAGSTTPESPGVVDGLLAAYEALGGALPAGAVQRAVSIGGRTRS